LNKGIGISGFSTDGDPKYLRAMRLYARFFAELPNLNLFKYDNHLTVNIPAHWTWFMMHTKQVLLFLQDPTHLATKIRNRLFSKVGNMRSGDYLVDITSNSKIFDQVHTLISIHVLGYMTMYTVEYMGTTGGGEHPHQPPLYGAGCVFVFVCVSVPPSLSVGDLMCVFFSLVMFFLH
jgi:hypothetical protein